MKLWLDDVRPAPPGWTLCLSVAEAMFRMAGDYVTEASLDYDLDVCPTCHGDKAPGDFAILAPCTHRQTGLDLVDWMVRTGVWPGTPRIPIGQPPKPRRSPTPSTP